MKLFNNLLNCNSHDINKPKAFFLTQNFFEYKGELMYVDHLSKNLVITIYNKSIKLDLFYKIIGNDPESVLFIESIHSNEGINNNVIEEIIDILGNISSLPLFINKQEETKLDSFGISSNILTTLNSKENNFKLEDISYDLYRNLRQLDKIKDNISILGKSILSYIITTFNYFLNKNNYSFLFENIENKRALVMLSGGVDSTVLLYLSRHLGLDVGGIEFTYKNRPNIEKQFVKRIQDKENFIHYQMQYPHAINNRNKIKIDVQESNLMYYILASAVAKKEGYDYVIAGQILSDWLDFVEGKIYDEASPKIYYNINMLLEKEYGIGGIKVLTPFIFLNKNKVVEIGKNINVPFDLTWSCSESGLVSCGQCQQCVERKLAFKSNNIHVE